MNNKDKIKDLFSEKLGKYEAKVSPDLWANIASQIGTGTTVVATSMSLVTKWIIGVSSAAAIATGVIFIVNNDKKKSTPIGITETPIIIPETKNKQIETPALIDNSIVADNIIVEEKPSVKETIEKEETQVDNLNDQTDSQEISFEPALPINKNRQLVVNKEEKSEEKEAEPKKQEKQEVPEKKIEPISNKIEITSSSKEITLPNVFTPDNDGINDQFFIESEGLTRFNIVILDNQNKTVFQSNDPNFVWEGYDLTGNMSPKGKYLYYLTAVDENGVSIKKYSFLEIKR